MPSAYTDPIVYPEPLGEDPTIGELMDRIEVLYKLLDQADADRATAAQLTHP